MNTNTPENEPWNAGNASARRSGDSTGGHGQVGDGPAVRPAGPAPGAPVPGGPGTRTPARRADPLSWPLVLGLGAVALLWPLMQLTGLADAIGRQATPLVVALAVALVWVGVVGLGRAPRPVLTLTLAGVAYGVYLLVLGIVLGPALGDGGIPLSAIPWAMAPMLALDAFYGFLAGLLALVVQNVRGGRS